MCIYDDKLNPISYINGIPFRFLNFRGKAANFRIGNSIQKVFIPKVYVNNDGTIKADAKLDWWFYKDTNKHKIELYKEELSSEDGGNNGKRNSLDKS